MKDKPSAVNHELQSKEYWLQVLAQQKKNATEKVDRGIQQYENRKIVEKKPGIKIPKSVDRLEWIGSFIHLGFADRKEMIHFYERQPKMDHWLEKTVTFQRTPLTEESARKLKDWLGSLEPNERVELAISLVYTMPRELIEAIKWGNAEHAKSKAVRWLSDNLLMYDEKRIKKREAWPAHLLENVTEEMLETQTRYLISQAENGDIEAKQKLLFILNTKGEASLFIFDRLMTRHLGSQTVKQVTFNLCKQLLAI